MPKKSPKKAPKRPAAKPLARPIRRRTILDQFPRHPATLELMMQDLGSVTKAEVAKALGVDESTVRGWVRRGQAPRPALLALHYLTSWGRSEVHCHAHNDATWLATTVAVLTDQLARAEAQLARLGQIGDFGSANDPVPGAVTAPGAFAATSSTSATAPVSPGKTGTA